MTEDLIIKNKYTWSRLKLLSERRSDQRSFHIFSEASMRGQIFNLRKGQRLEKVSVEGNLLITGLAGSGQIVIDGDTVIIEELDQIMINPNVPFCLSAQSDSSFQFVWSPPFEKLIYEIKGL